LLLAWLPGQALAMPAMGEVREAEGDTLLYREYHACNADGTQCTVEYRTPVGKVFAHKWLDYSDSRWAPELRFDDRRSGREVVVGNTGVEGVVVDAGFDNYVRERWTSLAAGEPVEFPFLVAGREQPVAMLARASRGGGCAAHTLCLVVTPANWLYSWLVEPIRLVYDGETRRLLQFRGLSNIRADDGSWRNVVIDYRYPSQ